MPVHQFQKIAIFAVIGALSSYPISLALALSASGQTRYEWVPGSRQARVVPSGGTTQAQMRSGQQQAPQPGQVHAIRSRQATLQLFQMQQAGLAAQTTAQPVPKNGAQEIKAPAAGQNIRASVPDQNNHA